MDTELNGPGFKLSIDSAIYSSEEKKDLVTPNSYSNWGLNEVMHAKLLAKSLAPNKHSMNVSYY